MELQTEKELIEKSCKDKKYFGEIYKEYVKDVYRFSYSIVNNKDKAEEITQEAFARAVEKIDKYEWRGMSIKSWLFGIARNVAYQSFAKKRELQIDGEYEGAEEIKYTDQGVDVKYQQDMSKALNQLPTVTREVIVLRIWEEYKFKEIAEIVSKSENAVKKQFYRGVGKLRELLEEKGYDKSYAVLPVMFKGVLQNKENEIYKVSVEFVEKIQRGLFGQAGQVSKLNKVNIMKNLTKEAKILIGIVSGVAIVGSVGVIWWASNRQVDVTNNGEDTVEDQDDGKDDDTGDVKPEESEVDEDATANSGNDDTNGQDKPAVVDTDPYGEWLTYTLDNPQLTFSYPEGFTVTTDYKESGELTMHISGSRGAVKVFMYEGAAGPGVGGFPEIAKPSVQKSVGNFFGQPLVRVESQGYLGYAMLVTKCKDPASCGGIPEPGCACSNINNYVVSCIYSADLEWIGSTGGTTYITMDLTGGFTEEEKSTYDQILNTFSAY